MFSILSSLDQNSWMMFRGRNVQAGAGAVMGAGDCSSGKMISYQDGPQWSSPWGPILVYHREDFRGKPSGLIGYSLLGLDISVPCSFELNSFSLSMISDFFSDYFSAQTIALRSKIIIHMELCPQHNFSTVQCWSVKSVKSGGFSDTKHYL